MKIVLLDGALANQMTQYIFARCLEKELEDTNEPVFLDDLWFYCSHGELCEQNAEIEKHQFQLNKFPNLKKVQLMSEYFDADVWQEIVKIAREHPPRMGGSYLPQILKDNGLDLFMIAEAPLYQFDGKIARMPYYYYIPEMLKAQGNAYYFGWFTHGGWFMSHEEMFRRELELPPLWEQRDLDMLTAIQQSLSISVNIRRGGYAATNRATPVEYFRNALSVACGEAKKKISMSKKHRKPYKPPHIFVFSDEIDWCREHAEEYGLNKVPYEVTWCAANRGPDDNQCDMQLMSECDIMILEIYSVYSYMAALLNRKSHKIVINPNKGRGVF